MLKLKQLKGSKWSKLLDELREEAGCRSSVLLRIDAEFYHSREESRAVHSQVRGNSDSIRVGFEIVAPRDSAQLELRQRLVHSSSQLHLSRSAKNLCASPWQSISSMTPQSASSVVVFGKSSLRHALRIFVDIRHSGRRIGTRQAWQLKCTFTYREAVKGPLRRKS
jgi:hypothetical protein